jgi:hypothetical protein
LSDWLEFFFWGFAEETLLAKVVMKLGNRFATTLTMSVFEVPVRWNTHAACVAKLSMIRSVFWNWFIALFTSQVSGLI